MTLLIIRHAIAEDRKEFARKGMDDAQRPLTKDGRKRMRQVARGLAALVPGVQTLASSPLVRAVQTAEIVEAQYKSIKSIQISALAPRKLSTALLNWLQRQPIDSTVAVIGHEPHLSLFITWMLTGLQDSVVELKKGGACLLRIDGELRPGRAKLLWLLKPSQLRQLK